MTVPVSIEVVDSHRDGQAAVRRAQRADGEIFTTLAEAQVLVARWRREYNELRPHSAFGYQPPAPPTIEARPAVGLQELQLMPTLT
jgi:hypothetical protein